MLRVLIVDEDREVARTLGEALETGEYAREVAVTREEAIESARAQSPDVLIVDFRIAPGYEGLDIADEIRAWCPSMRSILVTGYPPDETLEAYARDRGAERLVYKPFDVAELRDVVRAVARP